MAKNIHTINSSGQQSEEKTETPKHCPYDRARGLTDLLIRSFVAQNPTDEMVFSLDDQFGFFTALDLIQDDIQTMQRDYLSLKKKLKEKEGALADVDELVQLRGAWDAQRAKRAQTLASMEAETRTNIDNSEEMR